MLEAPLQQACGKERRSRVACGNARRRRARGADPPPPARAPAGRPAAARSAPRAPFQTTSAIATGGSGCDRATLRRTAKDPARRGRPPDLRSSPRAPVLGASPARRGGGSGGGRGGARARARSLPDASPKARRAREGARGGARRADAAANRLSASHRFASARAARSRETRLGGGGGAVSSARVRDCRAVAAARPGGFYTLSQRRGRRVLGRRGFASRRKRTRKQIARPGVGCGRAPAAAGRGGGGEGPFQLVGGSGGNQAGWGWGHEVGGLEKKKRNRGIWPRSRRRGDAGAVSADRGVERDRPGARPPGRLRSGGGLALFDDRAGGAEAVVALASVHHRHLDADAGEDAEQVALVAGERAALRGGGEDGGSARRVAAQVGRVGRTAEKVGRVGRSAEPATRSGRPIPFARALEACAQSDRSLSLARSLAGRAHPRGRGRTWQLE